ncbi:serine hydrolase [Pedobacter gandavensis]|uniref:Serine hydrolase n=1 Tax=Pedobacter gandavensis TaxID=2679963 RepID=A0ABR6ESA0_9SPHI|nr:serine hydrolase [Pedobacter gandavensis]MBB2148131.1 serine hydrolase [Pedobacter gandavensis]
MKSSFLLPLFLIASLSNQHLFAQSGNDTKVMIKKVESGLVPVLRFAGDSVWTMESRMKHYGVPGLTIAVIKNSKISYVKSYGIMDKTSKQPVTDQTLFQAASISKPVSAYAALKLVEQGRINPEENVNLYLKTWKLPDNEFTSTKKVNLKHLLSHSGGLTVGGFGGYTPGDSIPTLVQILNGEKPANSPEIRVDKVPGGSLRYAGGGYCVMQQMMIDLEGKPYPQIMNELVLAPLDMKNSTYNQPLTAEQLKFAATGYLPNNTEVPGKRHIYPEMAPAGLWTTATDLAKFIIDLQATLKGESQKVISQNMAKQMVNPFLEPFEGLGIFLEKRNETQYFNHGGWNEGFSSFIIGNTKNGDGVVILTNGNQPPLINEVMRAVAVTYNWPDYQFPIYKKLALNAMDRKKLVGRYRTDTYGQTKVYEQQGKLFIQNNIEEPTELFKVATDTYVMQGWERKLKFLVNPADQKTYMVFSMLNEPARYENPKLSKEEHTPYGLINEGRFEEGLAAFKKGKIDHPNHGMLNESYINGQGYQLLNAKAYKKAIDIFRLNTMLYPESGNAYDSLGEAYLANGDKSLAKENYQKALKLNPGNVNAAKILKSLTAE